MRYTAVAIASALIGGSMAYGQAVEIQSFGGNGNLTWSAPSGSVSTVEWTDNLSGTPGWRQSWLDLQDQVGTGGVMAAQVPVFYRVSCWTNGLFLYPKMKRTYYYSVSNSLGQVTTVTYSVVGSLELPGRTNRYTVAQFTGPSEIECHYVRADENALYSVNPFEGFQREHVTFRNAPVGTTWTNTFLYPDPADRVDHTTVTVFTNETVTVPAGTFECIGYHKMDDDTPPGWQEWWSPGLMLIKFVDLDGPGAPEISQLLYWTDE